jgi:hypothetical protein
VLNALRSFQCERGFVSEQEHAPERVQIVLRPCGRDEVLHMGGACCHREHPKIPDAEFIGVFLRSPDARVWSRVPADNNCRREPRRQRMAMPYV